MPPLWEHTHSTHFEGPYQNVQQIIECFFFDAELLGDCGNWYSEVAPLAFQTWQVDRETFQAACPVQWQQQCAAAAAAAAATAQANAAAAAAAAAASQAAQAAAAAAAAATAALATATSAATAKEV